jgi:hypothetical protein
MATTSMVEAALAYAERGWPVFPCAARGKVPLTAHGLQDATTRDRQIQAWWERCPTANVALRTGQAAKTPFIVVDVDGDDGYESLRALERAYGELPRTASVKTPRGGEHYYLQHPGGHVPNSAGQVGKGIDIRGDGGYVLAPPSVGPNGNAYEPDERTSVAPAPSWLCRALSALRPRRARRPAETWVRMIRDGLTEGARNEHLTKLVGHFLAHGIEMPVVRAVAHIVNERNRPPLEDREVDRIVESIWGREMRKRGWT